MSSERKTVRSDAPDPDVGRLARTYGVLHAYFKAQPPERWASFRRRLNQAHVAETYERYLARITLYALAVGVAGTVLAFLLVRFSGVVGTLSAPVDAGGLAPIAERYEAVVEALATVVLAVLSGGVLAAGTWGVLYAWPSLQVQSRRQAINVNLPHAITFMYAMSRGGMNVVDVFRETAAASDAYGAAAEEFGVIVRDVETFNTSLLTAVRDASDRTPSEELERFLDDLVTVVESGGDLPGFLRSETDRYLEGAREEQRDFLETLSLLAEVYVTLFVAGPVFLIIILLVIGMLGGSTLSQVSAVVYVGIPLGSLLMLVVLDVLATPYAVGTWSLDLPESAPDPPDDDRVAAYRRRKRRARIGRWLARPLGPFVQRPTLSLLVSVPLALVVLGSLVASGVVEPGLDAILASPVAATTEGVVVPLLVVATPLAALYEVRAYRRRQYRNEFTAAMSGIANANEIGIGLTESIELVAKRRTAALSRELSRVRNDVEWTGDVGGALVRFANRVRVPRISRTVKLVVEAYRSTGELDRVLTIAAQDSTAQATILRERNREVSSYLAIVVIGFLVYLGIVLLLDTFYLATLAEAAATQEVARAPETPLSLGSVNVVDYRRLFFHSALLQGLFGGLIAGKMASDDVLSGVKISIVLVLVSVLAFYTI